MKAGMNTRSAKLSQRSFTISDVSTVPPRVRPRDQRVQRIRPVDDIGIGEAADNPAAASAASAASTP